MWGKWGATYGEKGVCRRTQKNLLAHLSESLPRVLSEEAEADVEGGAAPVLERVGARERVRRRGRHGEDVLGAHARREEALVRVAPRGVGDEHAVVVAHGAREPRGALPLEHLLQPRRRRRRRRRRDEGLDARRHGTRGALDRASVDDEIGEIVEELQKKNSKVRYGKNGL